MTPKQAAFYFFLKNCGYSYDPKTETPRQGKARTARELAKAERDARALGFWYEWDEDDHYGNHANEPDAPATCELCICYDANSNVLATQGCIDDADRDYRRVVEAELALGALKEWRRDSLCPRCAKPDCNCVSDWANSINAAVR